MSKSSDTLLNKSAILLPQLLQFPLRRLLDEDFETCHRIPRTNSMGLEGFGLVIGISKTALGFLNV